MTKKNAANLFHGAMQETGSTFADLETRFFPVGDVTLEVHLNTKDWEAAESACRNQGKRLDQLIAEWAGLYSSQEIAAKLVIVALQDYRRMIEE